MGKGKRTVFNGRPPDSVIDNRVAQMVQALAKMPNIHRCQLHKIFCKEWKVHWRTVDRTFVRARATMIDRLNRSLEDFRAESVTFYESVKSDPSAPILAKLRAQERLDKVVGAEAPHQIRIAGEKGAPPIQTQEINPCAGLSIDRLREIINALAPDGNGVRTNGEAKDSTADKARS